MIASTAAAGGSPGRGWPRAAGLLGVVMALSVLRPSVLIAVPLLALLATGAPRERASLLVAVVTLAVIAAGSRDGLWLVERAWALLLAGTFVSLTMLAPAWRLTSRALVAVAGAMAVGALALASRGGSWATLDWTISEGIAGSVASTLDALAVLRQGRMVSPALMTAMYEMADAQAEVFPALVALASMAGLGVAWWAFTRVTGGGDQGIGPLRAFRFNDHLVWLFIGGLVLVLTRWGEVLTRIGANALVFMAALYALRGAGVVMAISGGLSLFAYGLLTLGLFLAAPVVLGVAVMIGIGDTWIDLRARAGRSTA